MKTDWINQVAGYANNQSGGLSHDVEALLRSLDPGRDSKAVKQIKPDNLTGLEQELAEIANQWVNSLKLNDITYIMEGITNSTPPPPGPKWDRFIQNFVLQLKDSKDGFDLATEARSNGEILRTDLKTAERIYTSLKRENSNMKPINYYLGTQLGIAIKNRLL